MELNHSRQVYHFLKTRFCKDVEEFWCIALNSYLRVIHSDCLFRGTVDHCMIHPRELFRYAYKHNASKLIIAHNHPSGDPTPSQYDLIWTRRLMVASNIFGIPILDHVVVGNRGYHSMSDHAQIPTVELSDVTDHVLEVLVERSQTKPRRFGG